MENPDYVQFSSYWNDIIVTGLLPLILLCYMNLRVFVKIKVSIYQPFFIVSTGSPSLTQFLRLWQNRVVKGGI